MIIIVTIYLAKTKTRSSEYKAIVRFEVKHVYEGTVVEFLHRVSITDETVFMS